MLERFLKNSVNYWFFFILTGLLCFGYGLTHSSMGVDDEILSYWSQFTSLLGVNRLGLFLTGKIFISYEYIPFVREFLFVIIYMFSINIYIKIFSDNFSQIFDEKSTIIFSCTMLAFPYTVFSYCFMDTNLENALSILLSSISVYLFYVYNGFNSIKKYILVFVFLIFSISFYETGIIYFLMIVFAYSIFKMICNQDKNKLGKELIISLTLSFLSLFINHCILLAIKKIIDFDREDKICELIKYDFSSLNSFLISIEENISKFINNFTETCKYDSASQMIVVCCLIFFIIMIFYSVKKNKKFALLGIVFFILPLLPFFITGNYEFFYRVYAPYSLFCAISFVLLYSICKRNEILKRVCIFFIFFAIFLLIQEINRILYTEYLKFQNDRMFAYSLKQEVLKLGDRPLLIIGVKENPELNRQYYIEAAEINVSIFNWDRYDSIDSELFINRPYAFMKEQGYEVKAYKDYVEINNEQDYNDFVENIKKLSLGMTIYPINGSIKDCGDFILIKIGKSKFDYNN